MCGSYRRRLLVLFFAAVSGLAGCSTSSGAATGSGEASAAEPRAPTDSEGDQGATDATTDEKLTSETPDDGPYYESEEDTSPQAAAVIRPKVIAPSDPTVGEPTTKATLKVLESKERSPTSDVADPAPRELVTSFQLAYATGRNRGAGFTSGVGVQPYAGEIDEVAPKLASPAARQYALWFGEPFRTTLAAYQDEYGGVLRAERFTVDGDEVQLVVFARSEKTRYKVSIYDERYFYTAVAFAVDGTTPDPLWAVDLSNLFEPYRELDDIQLGPDGMLFVNANYQSYAKEVDGETAYMHAIHPEQGELLWKTGPLVSRGDFLVMDGVVLTGYGFTAEPDYLYALDAETGARLDRVKIPTAHDRMRESDNGVQVVTYDALLRVDVQRPAANSD